MTHDSALFRTAKSLRDDGFVFESNYSRKNKTVYVPLYEGKMIWMYNHRLRSAKKEQRSEQLDLDDEIKLAAVETNELEDASYYVTPRHWVDKKRVLERLGSSQQYILAYRAVTNATNERTTIFSIIPFTGTGNTLQLAVFNKVVPKQKALFLANMNALVFDYIVRQKLGKTLLSRFILEQLPVLPFSAYNDELVDSITAKVLELSYTSWDLQEFAKDVGYVDEHDQPRQPFCWQENDRAHLQAELDAIYAHLYDISRDDLDYILETFPIVKRNDEQKHGTFRTKELVLQYYDEYFGRITPVSMEV